METLLLIGLVLLFSQVGANLLRKLKIPQVVAYILMGVLLGRSLLGWIHPDTFSLVTNLALGLIGFTIGSQLNLKHLKRLGSSILWIANLEAFAAFFLVAISVWFLTHNLYEALIFGALASATAPAATVDVLQEYRCKGVLTTTLLAVIGIDDAIALLIYSFAQPFARMLFSPDTTISILHLILEPVKELGLSVIIGAGIGWLISVGISYFKMPGERLSVTLAIVFISCGVSVKFNLSLILTNMVVGMMLGNLVPGQSRRLSDQVMSFTPPLYILFFAVVGSRLDIRLLPVMGTIGIVYIIARAAGKFSGAYLGAIIGKAPETVRKYIGLGLFSQAGAAIGLAIAASIDFASVSAEGAAFGDKVLNVITATTFVVQMLGPSLTKMAVFKAGEAHET